MKRTSIFTVLMLLVLLSFISCDSERDRSRYRLKLSDNHLYITQLHSDTVYMFASNVTTVEVSEPEIVDAEIIWEKHQEYPARIEIRAKMPGAVNIIVTDPISKEKERIYVYVYPYKNISFDVKERYRSAFHTSRFNLKYSGDNPVFQELNNLLDSITWSVEGESGSHLVFNRSEGEGSLQLEWEHCFMTPREYKTFLTGWIENQMVIREQADVIVSKPADFLSINWREIKESTSEFQTLPDLLGNNPKLGIRYNYKTDSLNKVFPSAEVILLSSNSAKESYDGLYAFMNTFYSAPIWSESHAGKDSMRDYYNSTFSKHKKYPDAQAIDVWREFGVKIVLLKIEETDGTFDYLI